MTRYKVTISYDGTAFSGFQRQPEVRTVQEEIELISKIGSQAWDKISQKADEVYQLGHPKISEQTYGRYPIVK
jgi:hypothetical protein